MKMNCQLYTAEMAFATIFGQAPDESHKVHFDASGCLIWYVGDTMRNMVVGDVAYNLNMPLWEVVGVDNSGEDEVALLLYEHSNFQEGNNRYCVSYFWRGDVEDEEQWFFATKEDAWDFIKGEIEKRIDRFKGDEETHGKTEIDFDLVKKHLFENGQTKKDDVVYCQCSAWWDNWFLTEEK